MYLKYKQDISQESFISWQINNLNINQNTARANNFPVNHREFDLDRRSLDDVKSIAGGGIPGLITAIGTDKLDSYRIPQEREFVCLVDVFITGLAYKTYPKSEQRFDYICNRLCVAGTRSSASTLLAVGRNVGRHFGLLDNQCLPTKYFYQIFSEGEEIFLS